MKRLLKDQRFITVITITIVFLAIFGISYACIYSIAEWISENVNITINIEKED